LDVEKSIPELGDSVQLHIRQTNRRGPIRRRKVDIFGPNSEVFQLVEALIKANASSSTSNGPFGGLDANRQTVDLKIDFCE
jgi:hypothetical protein